MVLSILNTMADRSGMVFRIIRGGASASPQIYGGMIMSKIRITVDIEINDEERDKLNITEETILSSMRVEQDDVLDGVLIFQSVEGLDPTSDIVLGDGIIVSKKIIK